MGNKRVCRTAVYFDVVLAWQRFFIAKKKGKLKKS